MKTSTIHVFCLILVNILCHVSGQSVLPLTDADKDAIVRSHNILRSSASPAASNMREMVYSDELGMVAQDYARMCSTDHSDRSERNQAAPSFSSVGENIFATAETNLVVNYTNYIVDSWGLEEKQFYSYDNNSCGTGGTCGHYTQIIWADTTHVGCGSVRCSSQVVFGIPGLEALVFICNYGPAGNVVGQRPYLSGTSCSICPEGFTECNDNLCSQQEVSTDATGPTTLVSTMEISTTPSISQTTEPITLTTTTQQATPTELSTTAGPTVSATTEETTTQEVVTVTSTTDNPATTQQATPTELSTTAGPTVSATTEETTTQEVVTVTSPLDTTTDNPATTQQATPTELSTTAGPTVSATTEETTTQEVVTVTSPLDTTTDNPATTQQATPTDLSTTAGPTVSATTEETTTQEVVTVTSPLATTEMPTPQNPETTATEISTMGTTLPTRTESFTSDSLQTTTTEMISTTAITTTGTTTPRPLITLNGDSPRVAGNRLFVSLDMSVSMETVLCFFDMMLPVDCSSGSVDFLVDLSSYRYHILRIKAVMTNGVRVTIRRTIKTGPEPLCIVNFINSGAELLGGGQVRIEFSSSGPVRSFLCALNAEELKPCVRGQIYSNVPRGLNRIKIVADGCGINRRNAVMKFLMP